MVVLAEAAPVEAEILSPWLADLTLAKKLGWERPVPLVATAITQPALRRNGRRPRPSDADWEAALAIAYAHAAAEAYGLAGDLSRRAERLLAVQPKLRAKGADRVVALVLSDDAVSPARAAKAARLSDRTARRLFDRLWCKRRKRGIFAEKRATRGRLTAMLSIDDLFKGRHFDREIIILCVRWYLRFKLSFRDLVEMMAERGLSLAHTTVMRWIERYIPEFEKRWNRFARQAGGS